jgi:hypothetical protein
MPFSITISRMKRSELTTKAMAHLHGKRLMDLLTPSEESFVRFLVILEIIRYHSESILPLVSKYNSLFYDEDEKAITDFIATYTKEGVDRILTASTPLRRKPFKGYRNNDISLFTVIKKQVLLERKNSNTSTICPSGDETRNITPSCFTFQYPEAMVTIKLEKLEPDDSDSSKKRKHAPSNDCNHSEDYSSVAMEFDDGEVAFDYSQVNQLYV